VITKDLLYQTFKSDESYCLPHTEVSLDRAAIISALILITKLRNMSFGVEIEGSFQGVILSKDLELLERELKEESLKLGVDSYFE
jgi:hypothetical protein